MVVGCAGCHHHCAGDLTLIFNAKAQRRKGRRENNLIVSVYGDLDDEGVNVFVDDTIIHIDLRKPVDGEFVQ